MSQIYFADEITPVNPFTDDGLYDDSWVELSITNSNDFQMMTGKTIIFEFKISKQCEGWQLRAMDYVQYQILNNRNVIVTAPKKDYEESQSAYHGHSIYDKLLHPYEPKTLVHSTTAQAHLQIQKDGKLKSWNRLKSNNNTLEEKPIGSLLGDPSDFSDFVMLGGGVAPGIVVNSRVKGFICMDSDNEYTPCARFYFDTRQLAVKGLLISAY